MVLSPRQIAVRAREAASLLVLKLEREELVAQFVRAYASENSRPGHVSQPALFHDLVETIHRESLLAMVSHLDSVLPARFAKLALGWFRSPERRGTKKRPTKSSRKENVALQSQLLELFRQEFFATLGEVLNQRKEDFALFCEDLEVYKRLSECPRMELGVPLRGGSASSPFVDRCAILLDPSLIDQARRAARKFESKLHSSAISVLNRVFSRWRTN